MKKYPEHAPADPDPRKNLRFKTRAEIMAEYNISFVEFQKLEDRVEKMRLLDILFHFPDGVCRDIALWRMTTAC